MNRALFTNGFQRPSLTHAHCLKREYVQKNDAEILYKVTGLGAHTITLQHYSSEGNSLITETMSYNKFDADYIEAA